jgi:MerR family mercuric resistance operon transcriptional regulator
MEGLTIGKFAEAGGVGVETVRFYQRRGFTLAEIGDLLGPAEARSTEEIVRAAEAKLGAIAGQLAELARLQCRLRRLVRVCAHGSSDDCLALQFDDGQFDDGQFDDGQFDDGQLGDGHGQLPCCW